MDVNFKKETSYEACKNRDDSDINELAIAYLDCVKDVKKCISEKIIPEVIPCIGNVGYLVEDRDIKTSINSGKIPFREDCIKNCSYASLAMNWIRHLIELLKDKKCVELMSGKGALTKILYDSGIDIISTDDFSWEYTNLWYDNIEKISAVDAVEKYSNADYFICSWPPMDNSMHDVLMKMREVNPNARLIYIGENEGGCTANFNFFKDVEFVDNDIMSTIQEIYTPHDYIYDNVYMCK